MIGYVVFMLMSIWVVCLTFGMLLAHMTWTPPGQGK